MAKLYAVVMENLFGLIEIHYTTPSKEEAIEHCKWHLRKEQKKPPLERRRFFILELEDLEDANAEGIIQD